MSPFLFCAIKFRNNLEFLIPLITESSKKHYNKILTALFSIIAALLAVYFNINIETTIIILLFINLFGLLSWDLLIRVIKSPQSLHRIIATKSLLYVIAITDYGVIPKNFTLFGMVLGTIFCKFFIKLYRISSIFWLAVFSFLSPFMGFIILYYLVTFGFCFLFRYYLEVLLNYWRKHAPYRLLLSVNLVKKKIKNKI